MKTLLRILHYLQNPFDKDNKICYNNMLEDLNYDTEIIMVAITDVLPRSRAQKAGILVGDILVSINGREICDVLDYRFHLANTKVELLLLRDGNEMNVTIVKSEYDDIGLDFLTPLMDKKHSCENKCVFCFIDQLPKGLRSSLYFKDDDSRLSFLHGNYITLTNLQDKDIDRIIEMHISPVNISVHTTNPELRVRMMHNKRAGDVLKYIDKLADAGISICGQIVLCKGLNDKAELERTMNDLERYFPALKSVSIVPAGLTQFRDNLYPLEVFTKDECREVIANVSRFADKCMKKYGTRLFWCSDEFYIKAELPLPKEEYYEEYAQIENGVGMLTSLTTEVSYELDYIDEYLESFVAPRTVSLVTGIAAYKSISELCHKIEEKAKGLKINIYPIKNNFFGEHITVAGLLTATDMIEQLKEKPLGDELLFPSSTLRAEGDLFLDDMTPDDLSRALKLPVRACESEGDMFIKALLGIKN